MSPSRISGCPRPSDRRLRAGAGSPPAPSRRGARPFVGHQRVWAVENSNRVSEVRLNEDLTAGSVDEVITDPAFHTPSTAIRFDGGLAVVNAKFDTGFPPTADQYEVVLVDD
jgi:hypothetical protein